MKNSQSDRLDALLNDTPGILAGKKQTQDRSYSYEEVVKWFAPRCDIILIMFDANKVDISDEFKRVIQARRRLSMCSPQPSRVL